MEKVIACDFDGTITEEDVCDEIMTAFSDVDWQSIGEEYVRGEISHAEMNARFIQSVRATPAQLDEFLLDRIRLRAGFHYFLERCKEEHTILIILSGGWDYYIRKILGGTKLNFPKSLEKVTSVVRDEIAVVCNNIVYKPGNGWSIEFPFSAHSKECTPDKRAVVTAIKGSGCQELTIIGDGFTDQGMAVAAHRVFARKSLVDFCRNHRISFECFEDFNDISSRLF
ncbi:hypothetical protein COY07_04105 [Candidatus Peregrinibacteria bacterium CG_4_10_14_0_2_um_filter_43_11]|nr:MAG: hypothetical protein COY07_04105 [Candidatus Peregrinibacteria bacterium CG_4_10_14_0_2_um_filter_43_11]